MTDTDLVTKQMAPVRELRSLARPLEIERDLREERFVEHTLQLDIQAALDVASHLASSDRLGEPLANRRLFELLAGNGWLCEALASQLRDMAGFRT